jgi:N-hydroxyarylamine O-acetyltransferase
MKVRSARCLIEAMDFATYLQRIALEERPEANLAGLFALHRAHQLAIPFENIDVRLGRGVDLDPAAVFDKLVTRRRGGYCFEQNGLFGEVLNAAGFRVKPLLGRVWLSAPGEATPPRTHLINLVQIEDEEWIVDVGFGASYTPPMLLRSGYETEGSDGAFHRLRPDANFGWMLEFRRGGDYKQAYSFTTDAVAPVDIEQCNHWTATWPQSRFVQNLVVGICLPNGLASLFNRSYSRSTGLERVESEITSNPMLQMRLSLIFGIDLNIDDVAGLGLFK